MLLFRPFLTYYAQSPVYHDALGQAINKCVDSAKATIEIVYETYRVYSFFRTWYVVSVHKLHDIDILGGTIPHMLYLHHQSFYIIHGFSVTFKANQ
jgi:hypothetical protein